MTSKSLGSFSTITDKSGKTRVVADRKAQLASLPVNKQITVRKSKRVKVVRPSKT